MVLFFLDILKTSIVLTTGYYMKTGALFFIAIIITLTAVAPSEVLAVTTDECLACHSDKELVDVDSLGNPRSLFVDQEVFRKSIHGQFECESCHPGITDLPHEEKVETIKCSTCHEDVAATYNWHGRERVGDSSDLPTCSDCHGVHDIFLSTEKESRVNPQNLPKTCGRCHENIDLINKYNILRERPVAVFKNSIHGKASLGGLYSAATCNDCHSTEGTAHKILSPQNPNSSINHFNVPRTCGKCHKGVENDYWEGIHGQLVLRGETDAPICTDCHGEHGILSHDDPRSPVSPTRVAEATCSPCHESARLNEKYDIPTGRLKTWVDSYHGMKSKAGDVTVANCASCHGAHRILDHNDPSSSIYPENLQNTCGHCHPGISATLANTPIHGTPGVTGTPVANIVKNIYIIAIILIIGAMAIHWLIDLRKQIKRVFQLKQIKRMTYNEVWQHIFLTVTFIVLVVTGFSLRFSDAAWVKFLFGWEGGFPVRGIVHRAAAALFIMTAIWHTVYLAGKRGRRFLVDMMPAKKDFTQFFGMLSFNLGRKKDAPRFGRFSYVEKAEYWALVWGSVVMIISGFFLWFDNFAVKWFPKGFLDVMLVIHYYEAWLASLAILIWHMYSVVFRPGVYPMNPAWLSGSMPEEMYSHEHPEDPAIKGIKGESSTGFEKKNE